MRHGTTNAYLNHRCRCAECKKAYSDYRATTGRKNPRSNGRFHRDGTLDSSCWCERDFVRVTPDDVKAGRTGSCGHVQCQPKVAR